MGPDYFYEFSNLVGQEPALIRLSLSPATIRSMEETLTWTIRLDLIDDRIVRMRAHSTR